MQRIVTLVSFLAVLACAAAAQTPPLPKIHDVVRDERGNVVSSAHVHVYERGTNTLAQLYANRMATVSKGNPLYTDARGMYFAYLEAGEYDVMISRQGFQTQTTPDVAVGIAVGSSGVVGNAASIEAGELFYPYVINGFTVEKIMGTRQATVAPGKAVIAGRVVEKTEPTTITFDAGATDLYLSQNGSFFQRQSSIYYYLPMLADSLRIANVEANQDSITILLPTRPVRFVAKNPPGRSFDTGEVIHDFWIPDSVSAWVQETEYGWADLAVSGGIIYKAFVPYDQDQIAQSSVGGEPTGGPGDSGWIHTQDFGWVYPDTSTFTGEAGTVTTVLLWSYFAPEHHGGSIRYGRAGGELWYFSNIFINEASATFGAEKTRKYLDWHTKRMILPWSAEEEVTRGILRTRDLGVYECWEAGTTSADWDPEASLVDGTVTWRYYARAHGVYPAWQSSTEYAVGDLVMASGQLYVCTEAGGSGTTPPSGRGGAWGLQESDAISPAQWEWRCSLYEQAARPVAPDETSLSGHLEFAMHASDTASGIWGGNSHYWKDSLDDFTARHEDSHGSYAATWIRAWFTYFEQTGRYDLLDSTTVHGEPLIDLMVDCAWNQVYSQQLFYPAWQQETEYLFHDQILVNAVLSNGRTRTRIMKCVTPGTSGTAEPTWPLEYPETAEDGTAVWQVYAHGNWGNAYGLVRGITQNSEALFRVSYLMDNCVHWDGLEPFVKHLEAIGHADATYYRFGQDTMASGVGTLFDVDARVFRYADIVTAAEADSSFYPWVMAQYHPEFYQVPCGWSPQNTRQMWTDAWEYASQVQPQWSERYWYPGYPPMMQALTATKWRGETWHGHRMVESWQGYMQPDDYGYFTIADVGYLISLKTLLGGGVSRRSEYPLTARVGSRILFGDGGDNEMDRPAILWGTLSPEGRVFAGPGSLYMVSTDSTANLFFKTTGGGLSTGWESVQNP